VTNGDIYHIL